MFSEGIKVEHWLKMVNSKNKTWRQSLNFKGTLKLKGTLD